MSVYNTYSVWRSSPECAGNRQLNNSKPKARLGTGRPRSNGAGIECLYCSATMWACATLWYSVWRSSPECAGNRRLNNSKPHARPGTGRPRSNGAGIECLYCRATMWACATLWYSVWRSSPECAGNRQLNNSKPHARLGTGRPRSNGAGIECLYCSATMWACATLSYSVWRSSPECAGNRQLNNSKPHARL